MRIKLQQSTIKTVKDFLNGNSVANRGKFDGSKRNQAVGLACELEAHNYLLGYYPILKNGFDGGIDFVYKGLTIDVKSMERKGYVKDYYVNNFIRLQERYNTDVLLFCNYNNKERVVELCGWIYKKELNDKAKLYKAGELRTRSDGSTFELTVDNYEIGMNQLRSINEI